MEMDELQDVEEVLGGMPDNAPEVRISKVNLPFQVDEMAIITFEVTGLTVKDGHGDTIVEVPVMVPYVGTIETAIATARALFKDRIMALNYCPGFCQNL